MIDMTLEMAETAVKAAQAKARALRSPMTVTVVDEAGRLVLSARGDGTGFFSPETSRAKAMAAASFKKRTAELADLVAKGGFWSIVPTVLQGQILPTLGRLADPARRPSYRRHRLRRRHWRARPGMLRRGSGRARRLS